MAMQLKKQYLLFLLIFGCFRANAQVISGRILADTTNKPVSATITTPSGHQTSSNANGEFSIAVSGVGDTIKVFAIGYKTCLFPVKDIKQNNIIIRLKQVSIMLRDVVIRANRDHKKDSVNLRKDYAGIFNYQPKKLTDAFVSPPSNVPFAFVSVDLLTILSAITKKATRTTN